MDYTFLLVLLWYNIDLDYLNVGRGQPYLEVGTIRGLIYSSIKFAKKVQKFFFLVLKFSAIISHWLGSFTKQSLLLNLVIIVSGNCYTYTMKLLGGILVSLHPSVLPSVPHPVSAL